MLLSYSVEGDDTIASTPVLAPFLSDRLVDFVSLHRSLDVTVLPVVVVPTLFEYRWRLFPAGPRDVEEMIRAGDTPYP